MNPDHQKEVIRGLHFQLRPHDQAKLIRVIEGKSLMLLLICVKTHLHIEKVWDRT